MSNHYRAGALATADTLVTVTPEDAGWSYSGLEVFDLASGPVRRVLNGIEGVLVPLSATDVTVSVHGEAHVLAGRTGVFEAVSDWIYLPLGSEVTISADAGEVALCTARATEHLPLCVTSAEEVPVEVRGGGRASRQVTNIATPGSFAGADRINVCEVLTPGARRHRGLRAHQRGDLLLPDGPTRCPPRTPPRPGTLPRLHRRRLLRRDGDGPRR